MNRAPIKFKLAGESYTVRCEFGHVQNIEAIADLGLVAITRQAQAGELRLNKTTAILREALRLNGYEYDDATWQDICIRAGLLELMAAVSMVSLAFFQQPEKPKTSRKKANSGNPEAATISH
jgi:hypothetical protein